MRSLVLSYSIGLITSSVNYGVRWIPLYVAAAGVAAVVSFVVRERMWRRKRKAAAPYTTGSL